MQVDESYFAGEELAGFFVEEKMKRAWAAQIVVMKEVERICIKYGLRYFAGYGTMLGAIRHKGFIPWDDDIDIFMFREDYEQFLSVVQSETPKGYALLNVYTEKDYTEVFSRLVNSRKIDLSPGHLKQFYGCPYAVGIDIFPLDYISRNKDEDMLQTELFRLVLGTKMTVMKEKEAPEELLTQIETFCRVKIDRGAPILRQLNILLDRLAALYHRDESDEVTLIHSNVNGFTGRMKIEWFDHVVWMPFEFSNIPVPEHYDECLQKMFGKNYMKPAKYMPHDYPFYKKQDKALMETIKKEQARIHQKQGR